MTLKPISKEYRIYLAFWRKAYQDQTNLEITASKFSIALTMRQGMYRAIRPYRNGELMDEELRQAAETLVVAVTRQENDNSPHKLIIKPRVALSELEKELSRLGLDDSDLRTFEEKVLYEEMDKLIEAPEVPKTNPFYSRS